MTSSEPQISQFNRSDAMTSLYQTNRKSTPTSTSKGAERRQHRRHDMEQQGLPIDRWDGSKRDGHKLGEIVDLSAGGVRVRTEQKNIQPDHQIRVRLALPEYAGISPFIDNSDEPKPKREWVGWMAVTRVYEVDDKRVDVSGRLIDMDEMDRGMLSLYLSTQPLAA